MGFETLRVINDDRVAPGKGFGAHPHENMEIVSYVLEGELAHKDSLGQASVIKPGDVQRMSAGSGVTHSEFNPSTTEGVHFLQIWFLPEKQNIPASYAQRHFPEEERRGKWRLVLSQTGREGSLSLNQDVDIYMGLLDGDESLSYQLRPKRGAWVHVAKGDLFVNGMPLQAGDGLQVEEGEELLFTQGKGAELLLFDMRCLKS
jgi:redox-sensitive bicupin YhaK (pirin superfamily)